MQSTKLPRRPNDPDKAAPIINALARLIAALAALIDAAGRSGLL